VDLKNMALSKEERKAEAPSVISKPEGPRYPYGLELRLDDEVLKKLGSSGLPDVDDVVLIQAKAKVTSVSSSDYGDGTHRNICLQVTDLAVEPEKKKKTEDVIWGK
jgi:hypothetical protein